MTEAAHTQTRDAPGRSPEVEHLYELVRVSGEVLDHLTLLDSCRFGPATVVQAAVADLQTRVDALAMLGPKGGMPSLSSLHDPERLGADADLAAVLAANVRGNVRRIGEQSAALSLELRQLLADTRDVVAVATGSAGTYDATGRTTVGDLRRARGFV